MFSQPRWRERCLGEAVRVEGVAKQALGHVRVCNLCFGFRVSSCFEFRVSSRFRVSGVINVSGFGFRTLSRFCVLGFGFGLHPCFEFRFSSRFRVSSSCFFSSPSISGSLGPSVSGLRCSSLGGRGRTLRSLKFLSRVRQMPSCVRSVRITSANRSGTRICSQTCSHLVVIDMVINIVIQWSLL